jgi:mRNA interferase MazF
LSLPVFRSEIWVADLQPSQGSEQGGVRPVLVVSRDAINKFSPNVIAVSITDAANKTKVYPSHVWLASGHGGLTMDSVALCEQVRAISKTRLKRRLGNLSRAEMASIEAALKIALDLP